MRTLDLLLLSLPLALLSACGDDDGGVDCSEFTACGGDPTGTWTIRGTCIDPNEDVFPGCEGATSSGSPTETGTVTINADMTYTADIRTMGSASFSIPGSCLTGLTSCDQLEDEDTTCEGTIESSCSCDIAFDDTSMETGTYSTSGNSITLTPTGETPDTGEYCVSGNTLRVSVEGSIIVLQK